jgi:hypothetical protein
MHLKKNYSMVKRQLGGKIFNIKDYRAYTIVTLSNKHEEDIPYPEKRPSKG